MALNPDPNKTGGMRDTALWLFRLGRARRQAEVPEPLPAQTVRVSPSRSSTTQFETSLHGVDRTDDRHLVKLWTQVVGDLHNEALEADIVRHPDSAVPTEGRGWEGQVLDVEGGSFSVEMTSDDDDADEVVQVFFMTDVPSEVRRLIRPDARLRIQETAGPNGLVPSISVYDRDEPDEADIAAALARADDVAAAFSDGARRPDDPT